MAEFLGEDNRHLPRTKTSEIAYGRYGSNTFVKQTAIVCNIITSIIVPANPNRVSLILLNNSPSAVYVGFTPDVTTQFGLLLTANGGLLSLNINDEGEAVSTEIYGTTSLDGRNLTLIEVILEAL